jgi:lipopolysaccharide export system permease protein
MIVLRRYLSREIWLAIVFVLLALLGLFFLLDMLNEFDSVGKGQYRIQHAALFVLLELPATAYEILPIAALIGTVYALAQFASNSEFTIMRASGMATTQAAVIIVRTGLVIVIAMFLLGDYLVPISQSFANKTRLALISGSGKLDLRSGFWIKDVVLDAQGREVGSRFVNANKVGADGVLRQVHIYELDAQRQITSLGVAESAVFDPEQGWRLINISETQFLRVPAPDDPLAASNLTQRTRVVTQAQRIWSTRLDASVFASVIVEPGSMSTAALWKYVDHLHSTKQRATRYEIALWKKFTYPGAVFVLMLLALPFAYLHVRSGGVGVKMFAGIMLGVVFWFSNSLSAHVGMLNQWSPALAAVTPSLVALFIAAAWLRWVERH